MKNGKSAKVKVVRRGHKEQPVEYKLTLAFDLHQVEELGGTSVSGTMTVPIRKGAGDRLAKYKKEDVAAVLRQIADVVEKGDYSAFDPNLGAAIESGIASVRGAGKGKAAAN
jgi:hypothetical protein